MNTMLQLSPGTQIGKSGHLTMRTSGHLTMRTRTCEQIESGPGIRFSGQIFVRVFGDAIYTHVV